MIKPEDIHRYTKLSGKARQQAEQAMQEDELSYLSSAAFEQFAVSPAELDALNSRIDKRSGGSAASSLNTILVSLFCGLFIGISVFFVIFHKNQTHPSVYQQPEAEQEKPAASVALVDTAMPEQQLVAAVQKEEEHFSSIINQVAEPALQMELPERMSSKAVELPESAPAKEEDILFTFSPNAPVMFISNLKVTNYRLYYFRQNESVDLSLSTGLEAQYESRSAMADQIILNRQEAYLAHKVIQRAMKLFNGKHYANCIEELEMLYNYNKNDANAQFYLGMCYYLTGKYTIAQNYFQKNLDNENNIFHQEADFYQAMCLVQTGQAEKALERLKGISERKGFYSARAQEVISKQK